jgi:hypothetical protein
MSDVIWIKYVDDADHVHFEPLRSLERVEKSNKSAAKWWINGSLVEADEFKKVLFELRESVNVHCDA